MYLCYVNCQLGKGRKMISRYTQIHLDPYIPPTYCKLRCDPLKLKTGSFTWGYEKVFLLLLDAHIITAASLLLHIAGLCCAIFESHDSLPEILLLKVAPHFKLKKTWCFLCWNAKSTLVTMHLALTLKGLCPCGLCLIPVHNAWIIMVKFRHKILVTFCCVYGHSTQRPHFRQFALLNAIFPFVFNMFKLRDSVICKNDIVD